MVQKPGNQDPHCTFNETQWLRINHPIMNNIIPLLQINRKKSNHKIILPSQYRRVSIIVYIHNTCHKHSQNLS